jgi:2-alkyl-3-oxoalkanoate reductase
MKKKKVLVTGGNGFVGRHLVDALADQGHDVTVLEATGKAHRPDISFVEADIRDRKVVQDTIRGKESVFHNASIVHTRRNQEHTVWSVNYDGSENILKSCQEEGVAKLVYVSSASAVYEGKDIEGGDEKMPYSTISQAPYADSKIAAEKMILAANGHRGVFTTAIRPHVIFGPGDTRFLPAILKRARAGKLRFSIGKGKLSDFTYISNLIDALLLAEERLGEKSDVDGEAFFVTNGEPMQFFEFVAQVLEKLSLPKIIGNVPYPIAYTAAAIAEAIDTLRGGTLNSEDGMSRFAVRYMATHHYFSIDKAKKAFGYQPQVCISEGIDRTVAALQSQAC